MGSEERQILCKIIKNGEKRAVILLKGMQRGNV